MRSCPHEQMVRDAAAAGRWTEAARAHVNECAHCSELALVIGALNAGPPRSTSLDAGRLWIQGRIARRVRAEAQVSRVLLGVQATIGLALVALLAYAGIRMEVWAVLPLPYLATGGAACVAVAIAGLVLAARRASPRRHAS